MTPDRFDAMVKKIEFTDFDGLQAVLATDVVKLLRREHAAVRRMVKFIEVNATVPDGYRHQAEPYIAGYLACQEDLLAALDARKKGERK